MNLTDKERDFLKEFLQSEIKSLEALIRQMEKIKVMDVVINNYRLKRTAYSIVLNDISNVVVEEIKGTENE